ncbi:potassium channel family protein [Desulfotalea psychrophila]|uniref:RCK N-terminal domain-containing protein n=1 Tax=Desulfotalea psychrophila (strain LSv54 / DSM 12343) TaxID=177439 RepID=Q6ARH2_DESPS|nr:NAD-binding protein [Desulfotalea psychrophila]CAG35053.1 conserved hypothetical protein [Desulfotalea psychrophila LSv54]
MKFLPSQILYFFQNKGSQRNLAALAKFFVFLLCMVTLYSVLFHLIMLYEGKEYSWITGIYWALTVMSTLGFGDITFHTDLGLLFTIVVLLSGVVFLLIMLPFSFIQFFYAPWLEAQTRKRTPRELVKGVSGHVIITHLDPITERLVEKLKRRGYDYVIIVADAQRGMELHDQGYKIVVGEPDDPDTFLSVRVEDAALVVITNDDMMATNISFTIRGITAKVPIVAAADKEHSLDILNFPGNTQVFLFMKMLGESLAERVRGVGRLTKIVSSFDQLHIAEIPVSQTSLGGLLLTETMLRTRTGATLVGLWEKGQFEALHAKTIINKSSSLLLAGTLAQLDCFEEKFIITDLSSEDDKLVLVLGGGRVGLAASQVLDGYGVKYRVVEKSSAVVARGGVNFVAGDAANRDVLIEAGIENARAAIITTHDDAANIYLTFYCRQLRPDIQIISRATNERSVSKLHMAGADLVMSYASMGANRIMKVFKPDEGSLFIEGMNFFVQQIPGALVGKTLAESNVRQETGCSVVALRMDGELLVGPDPTLPLVKSTELILIGNADAEKLFGEMFGER